MKLETDSAEVKPEVVDDQGQEEIKEEFQALASSNNKRRRRVTVNLKSRVEKLAKCPHCLREFTNLKHHINQQHAQVPSCSS